MKLKKEIIESACRAAGLLPVRREVIRGTAVCIADGFSATPHIQFRRFGADDPAEFPFGAYLTIFWLEKSADDFEIGVPMLFAAFHNPEYDKETKKLARINTAINAANDFMKRRARIAKNGI